MPRRRLGRFLAGGYWRRPCQGEKRDQSIGFQPSRARGFGSQNVELELLGLCYDTPYVKAHGIAGAVPDPCTNQRQSFHDLTSYFGTLATANPPGLRPMSTIRCALGFCPNRKNPSLRSRSPLRQPRPLTQLDMVPSDIGRERESFRFPQSSSHINPPERAQFPYRPARRGLPAALLRRRPPKRGQSTAMISSWTPYLALATRPGPCVSYRSQCDCEQLPSFKV